MANESDQSTAEDNLAVTANDIQFDCPHCGNILIVDKEGIGFELECPHCKKMIIVPDVTALASQKGSGAERKGGRTKQYTFDFSDRSASDLKEHVAKLKRQLKENSSQRTEIQGYINQETIKLHRHKLQLEKLIDKRSALEAEFSAAQSAAKQGA